MEQKVIRKIVHLNWKEVDSKQYGTTLESIKAEYQVQGLIVKGTQPISADQVKTEKNYRFVIDSSHCYTQQ